MQKTNIGWTDYTWNPLLGCRRASPGCLHCYAERLIGVRFSKNPKLPMYHDIARVTKRGKPQFTGKRKLLVKRLDEPLRVRKGAKVFVCDMGDIFFEEHPFEDIASAFGVMAAAQHHTFQVLTKRAKRMAEFFAWLGDADHARSTIAQAMAKHMSAECSRARYEAAKRAPWPLPNVWLGVSVEDRRFGLPRIEALRATPAAVRLLSIEPLLEDLGPLDLRGIGWVIVGGESGPGARSLDIAWARSLRDQCAVADVPYFFKQGGAHVRHDGVAGPRGDGSYDEPWPAGTQMSDNDHVHDGKGWRALLRDSHGADPEEWPADLRVQQFPR